MNKLREIREKKKWSIKDAARCLDLLYEVYVNIENGELDGDEDYVDVLHQLETALKSAKKKKALLSFEHPIFLVPAVFKGGTGKSSSVANISGALAEMGYRVLLVDTDGQCDTTFDFVLGFGEEDEDNPQGYKTLYDAMKTRDDIRKYIVKTEFVNIDIVPSDPELRHVEEFLTTQDFREQILETCFEELVKDNIYDFVILDVNNQMSKFANVVWNITKPLYVYSVFLPKTNSIKQFRPTIDIIEDYKHRYNKQLYHIGAILNMVDERTNSSKKARIVLEDELLPCVVRTDENVDKAQEEGMPVNYYLKSSKASKDYEKVVKELLKRIEVIESGR